MLVFQSMKLRLSFECLTYIFCIFYSSFLLHFPASGMAFDNNNDHEDLPYLPSSSLSPRRSSTTMRIGTILEDDGINLMQRPRHGDLLYMNVNNSPTCWYSRPGQELERKSHAYGDALRCSYPQNISLLLVLPAMARNGVLLLSASRTLLNVLQKCPT